MPIVIIIALLLGGGTSFAAERALPGDVLYPVKVSVNEEVRGFFTISDEDRAAWQARRVERRLEEAEKIIAKKDLSEEKKAEIIAKIEAHANAVNMTIGDMVKGGKNGQVLEVSSDVESKLRVHQRIITNLDGPEVQPIITKIVKELETITKAKTLAEAHIVKDNDGITKTSAEGKLKAAEHKIEEVKEFIAKQGDRIEIKVSAEATTKLAQAEKRIAEGKTKLTAGLYGEAFILFQQAHRLAQEAKISVAAQGRIDVEIRDKKSDTDSDKKIREDAEDSSDTDARKGPLDIKIKSDSDINIKVR